MAAAPKLIVTDGTKTAGKSTTLLACMVSPHANEDDVSVEELLAELSGPELLAASKETSLPYNGIVLARACLIVQGRLRYRTPHEMARRIGIAKSTACRWMLGRPMSNMCFERALRDLALLLAER